MLTLPAGVDDIELFERLFAAHQTDPHVIPFAYEDPVTNVVSVHQVDLRKDWNAVVDGLGNTWLHIAAMEGQIQMVQGFIQHRGKDFNIDIRNQKDETPLMLTARVGRLKVAELLLENHADVNAMIRETKWSVLHEAAFAGDFGISKLFLDKGARITEAVTNLKLGNEIRNCLDCTPFIAALPSGNEMLLNLLIASGDNPHKVLSDGTNALHYVADLGNLALSKLLLSIFRVNPNQKSKEGVAPIHYVKRENFKEMIACFCENKADIDSVDKKGLTLLYKQCDKDGDPDLIIYLLDLGSKEDLLSCIYRFEMSLSTFEGVTSRHLDAVGFNYSVRQISPQEVISVFKKFFEKKNYFQKADTHFCLGLSNYIEFTFLMSDEEKRDLEKFKSQLNTCVIL